MLNKKLILIVFSLLVITVIFLSGCTQRQMQKGDTPISSLQKESVSIKNFAFNPAIITIKAGTTVTWINEDSVSHTVTSAEKFDSGIIGNGETFSYTFNKTGTFDYICTIHPSMKGRIIVEE